LCHRQRSGAVA